MQPFICFEPYILHNMNHARINDIKPQRLTPSGCTDLGFRKFEVITRTQVFCYLQIKSIQSLKDENVVSGILMGFTYLTVKRTSAIISTEPPSEEYDRLTKVPFKSSYDHKRGFRLKPN